VLGASSLTLVPLRPNWAAGAEQIEAQLSDFIGRLTGPGGTLFQQFKGAERRMVSVTPCAPDDVHKYGAAHLTESPGRDD
jgi:hypothetical protein